MSAHFLENPNAIAGSRAFRGEDAPGVGEALARARRCWNGTMTTGNRRKGKR